MNIIDGRITGFDEEEDREYSYKIEQITAEFGEDISEVIGVVRCTGIEIESDAPIDINTEAEEELYNEFADIEYNNADGGGFEEKAKREISRETGTDMTKIEIVLQ